MDSDGYPDEQELQRVREWPYTDLLGLMTFVESLWKYAGWGWTKAPNIANGKTRYSVSTAGWSGNESLIAALQDNQMFWTLCWQSSRRGGHYEFETPGPGQEETHA